MKILLLNQTFYPDVVSTAQHLSDLALALTEAGHEVTVVAGQKGYDNPKLRFPQRENWRGIEILRVSGTGFGKGAKWRRAVDFATFLTACGWRVLWLPRQDAVVALTSPPLISFLAAWFTKLRGGKFYYWVMDLNPDEAIAAGWLKAGSMAARCLDWMSRFSLRQAARVVALDRFMEAKIRAKGIAPERIATIPPWSHDDVVRFDKGGRDHFRQKHGLAEKFVIMYSGNHSPCHPLDTLLQAAAKMASEQGFAFLFVGGGSEFAKVQRFAAEHGLKNIICLPYQPLDQLAGSLSAADLHVVVMGNPFVGTIHPCKVYNTVAVGAPLLYIGPESSHVADVLQGVSGITSAWPVRHGDASGVVAAIHAAAACGQRLGEEHTSALVQSFGLRALLPKLVRVVTGR